MAKTSQQISDGILSEGVPAWRRALARAEATTAGLLVVGQCCLAGAVALSWGARQWWVADIAANLRVQWCAGAMGLALVGLLLRRRRDAALCVALLILSGTGLLHGLRFVAPAEPSEQSPRLTVCTANVLSSNPRYADILAALVAEQPEIIGVLETSPSLATILRRELGQRYPHQVHEPQAGGNFGIALLSQWPLESSEVTYLNDVRIPSIDARVATPDGTVRVVVTHTLPPMGQTAFEHRNEHLRLLAERVARAERDAPMPTIVIGDLNLTPWSPCFDDWLTAAGLQCASRGRGFMPTWRAVDHALFGLVLDHACTTPDLLCVDRRISPGFGSDHHAVTFAFARRTGAVRSGRAP
jgi:endonuclease/exonuclease/phosphatase (EEP) superfamily protein YafD